MFFKKLKDCSELINESNFNSLKIKNKFLSAASYSYPKGTNTDLMDRIYKQKLLIENYGVFETVYLLSKHLSALSASYVHYADKISQDRPNWSDEKITHQASCDFNLENISFTAEEFSSNLKTAVWLYKNKELIFAATNFGSYDGKINRIDIQASKLDEEDIKKLVQLANSVEDLSKEMTHQNIDTLMSQIEEKQNKNIEGNF